MQDLFSEQNFAALSREVHAETKQYGWNQQHGYEFIVLSGRILLFAAGFFIFSYTGWWAKIIGMLVISYAYYGISITGTHESRHNAWVKSAKWNKFWGYIFGDFWGGESSVWWYSHHVQDHHVYTNIYGKDEDYFVFPWINKYVYFFVAPYLVVPALFFGGTKFLAKQKAQLALYLILFSAGFVFHTYLFSLYISLGWAIACTFIMRSLYSPIFMHLALFNHIGLEKLIDKIPWLPHQTKTTRNLKRHWFLVGMGGNAFVDLHIEHHLFPSLSNRMLTKIHPIVLKYLHNEGYLYIEETYSSCLHNCLKFYRDLFKKGPPPLMVK